MHTAFRIAWRYFRGKKSAQAINIISWVTIGAIAVAAAAMVILFSVFNGLEDTVKSMYAAFYPQLKITPANGKFMELTNGQKQRLQDVNGLAALSACVEDMVLVTANGQQKVASAKGVENTWFAVCGLDSFMTYGSPGWGSNLSYVPAMVGQGISIAMGIDVSNDFTGMQLFYPKPGMAMADDPQAALNGVVVKPIAEYRIQDDFDGQYILVPLTAAQALLGIGNQISSVELKLKKETNEATVRKAIMAVMGNKVNIANTFEQNRTFFMIMRGEKWAVYFILLMVLLIASFNMIGSLSMVVLEKKKDIAILRSMGATAQLIRAIFLAEGIVLALVGGMGGMLLGCCICMGQQVFGWVKLPQGFVINEYPVSMQAMDFLLIFVTTALVGLLAALYPSVKAAAQPAVLAQD
ncbi:MAG: FtsX-like permease family protein [Edaphocola sp.]